jgi:peptidyl-prolyl cis-trans isomerase C
MAKSKIFIIPAALAWIASGSLASAAPAEVAKVNGKSITAQDIRSALGGLSDPQKASFLKDVAARRQVLSGLIDQEVLASQAEKDKIDQEPDFKEALARFRRQLMMERLVSKQLSTKLTDGAAKKYYEQHKPRFNLDQVTVQHILLDSEGQAKEVLKQAKEPNADFMELAEKHSKDPSAKNNRGAVGTIGRDAPFADAFKEAAFSTQEGQIAGPVRTSYGWHLIKVMGKNSGRTLGYDEVELRVKEMLRQEVLGEYLTKLRQQAKIAIDDKALEKM